MVEYKGGVRETHTAKRRGDLGADEGGVGGDAEAGREPLAAQCPGVGLAQVEDQARPRDGEEDAHVLHGRGGAQKGGFVCACVCVCVCVRERE